MPYRPASIVTCVAGFGAAVALCLPSPAEAQTSRHAFDIPGGPAGASLELFAKQSGRQILFPTDAIGDRRAPSIIGTFDDASVLERLVRAAGLAIASTDGPTIILQRQLPLPPPPPPRPARRPAPLPPSPPTPVAQRDIIVTAMKRSQSALSVPESISVLAGDQLSTLGVRTPADLQDVLPTLATMTVEHGISFNIRGITTTDITSKGDQGVAYNVDGIFIGRPIEQAIAFFDIRRIEVLRGPQGTLYGKSATGGAINVITNEPVDRWEGYGQIEVGNFAARRGQGAINVPLASWLAVRAAGNFNLHDGYLAPSDGGERKSSEDDRTGRLSARAEIGPNVVARVTLTSGHVGGTGTGYAELGNFIGGGSSAAKRTIYPNPFPASLDHHFINVDGQLNATLGPLRLTYVGARLRFDGDEQSANNNDPHDPDVLALPIDPAVQIHGRFVTRITSDEHEVRLSNGEPGRWDYVLGINYYHERIDENDHNLNAPSGDLDPALQSNASDIIGTTAHRSYGLFGQTTLHLSTKLGLIGGLRYSRDSVRRRGTSAFGLYDAAGNPCYGVADCIGNPSSGHERAGKLTYRIGLDYQLSPSNLLYASIATGYKAGGFNDARTPGGNPSAYAPEQLTACELGYKGRPAAGLELATSLYYYDYSKAQINGIVLVNGTGVLNTRIVPAVIYGWEGTANWTVSPSTLVSLSASIGQSHYVRFQAGYLQNIDWSHLPLDRVPTFAGTVSVDRNWGLSGGWSLRFHALSKISTHYFLSDFTSGLRFRQGGFTRSSASLTLSAPGNRWYLQAFVQNIENELQATSPPQNYDPTYLNASYLNISDPRLYGLRLGFTFG
ncbi:TonB-dependent receptor [Sphingomonas oryzagri]|uniref:TonB-dependent receptor n=1 Tax=Sphingomonas oryzagri TaxID=3042314 RepID=A0ABT6N2I4_9SPHN|nr:TonB-dependent receptor [Sphingomonas oryzagri]MDH7639251.1 TonB-dependent receptor [Sphingomonas oryzagri]